MTDKASPQANRNKAFARTHDALLLKAVDMISERGTDALSLSALAREAGVNRTTIYYHFESRETLLAEVQSWAARQISAAFDEQIDQTRRIEDITRFIVENPALMKIWIDEFITTDDVRSAYPLWDSLVDGMRSSQIGDPEAFAMILLAGALIGPRVYANSVGKGEDKDAVIARFRNEIQRLVARMLD